MSQTSKYFKVPSVEKRCMSFASKKVESWVERLNMDDISMNSVGNLTTINEDDDEVEELDWDDVGSVVSSCRYNKPYSTTSQAAKRATRKRKSSPAGSCSISSFGSFLRPHTPPTSTPIKVFKPVILTHNPEVSQSKRLLNLNESWSQDVQQSQGSQISLNLNTSCVDLNASFASTSSIQSVHPPGAYVNTSFQNILNYLDDLSFYSQAASICGSHRLNETFDQGTQTEHDNNTEAELFPRRSFDENSIDPRLAYDDINKFIKQIHEQNILFESESDVSEYINSQQLASQEDLSIEVVAIRDYTVERGQPSHVRALQKGLKKIEDQEDFGSSAIYERTSLEISNDRVKTCIRGLFAQFYDDIQLKRKLQVKVPRLAWKNTVFKDGVFALQNGTMKQFSILLGRTSIVLYLLRKIYGLLMLNTQLTQRSIYYQLKSLLPERKLSQGQVSSALNIVCSLLQAPYWDLNVTSTSKGLIYGDVTLTIGSTVLKCNAQNGTIIPNDLNNLRKVVTTAYFILIVEKDTVFQKLLADDLPNKLSRNFILVTGKGYPDIGTRRLLNILWKLLGIPMFIVVDADAYGIDIFLTYKFGSLSHSHMSEELALPKLKWLGVLPSEMKNHDIKTLPLKQTDCKKLKSMLTRPYFESGGNAAIRDEINALIKNQKMCEIEGIFRSNLFFAEYYLPTKLAQRSFL